MKRILKITGGGGMILLTAVLTFAFTGPGYNPGTANPSDPDRALTSTDPDPSLKDIYDALTSTDQDPFDDTQITPSSGIDTNPYSSLKSIWNEIYNTKFGGSATLTSANILTGKTIFGVEGSVEGKDNLIFADFQNLFLNGIYYGGRDMKHIMIDGEVYLGVVTSVSSGDSYIYKYLPDANCFGSGSSCGTVMQSIRTYSATDSEFFTIDGVTYLIIGSGANYSPKFYKWLPDYNCFGHYIWCGIDLPNYVSATYVNDWEVFTLGSDTYLAVCFGYTGKNSDIYKWMSGSSCFGDGSSCGATWQSITNTGGRGYDWEAFTIGSDTYLALANELTGSSPIYKYMSGSDCFGDGSSCGTAWQSITTAAYTTSDWESFAVDGETYLAVANTYADVAYTYTDDSSIYKYMSGSDCFGDGSSCGTALQNIETYGASDWESFVIEGETYLAVANYRNDTNSPETISSPIYKWMSDSSCLGDGTTCGTAFQDVVSTYASDWESFVIDGKTYLAIGSNNSNSYDNANAIFVESYY